MSAQIIPVTPSPANYQMICSLDGVAVTLVFSYNDRGAYWSMDIQDTSGNSLVDGVAMVPNYPLNHAFNGGQVPGTPPGIFFLLDETGQNRVPDNTNFGTEIQLFYNPIADVQAVA